MTDHNQLDDFFTPKAAGRKEKRGLFFSALKNKWVKKLKEAVPSKKQLGLLPTVLSPKERYFFICLALIIVASVLFIPISFYYRITKPAPDFGGSYSEGVVGEPRYVNPLLSQASDADRDISSAIFSGLMKYDPNGNLAPDLAKTYEISTDGLAYTFALKENIKWHDNRPLTTDDIVFTISAAQNQDYNSPQRINWQGIDVKKIDQKTVQFTLKNKYAQFLTNATLGILPEHVWKDIKPINFSLSELNLKPIGSGPYSFKKLKKDSSGRIRSYEVKAFKDYHGGKPFIDKVEFHFYMSEDEMIQAYNRNEIEGLSFVSPKKISEVKFKPRLNIQSIPIPRYFTVFFNQNQSKSLSDKNFRLALNYGTDRKALADQVLDGKGIEVYSPILPEILQIGESTQKYKYDAEFAQKILDNGGWVKTDDNGRAIRKNKKNEELTLKLTTSNWPELTQAAQLLEKQWEQLNVAVDLEILSTPELQQAIKERAYEALLFGEVLNIDLDPFSFWHSSQKKNPGLNLALYDNKTSDKILEETRQTINPLERAKKYDDFQKVLLEDAPAVFLYSPYYLYSPNKKIKGNEIEIMSIPSDRFDNIDKWYIKTKRVKK